MTKSAYDEAVDRAVSIPSGDDWELRFLTALDAEGLELASPEKHSPTLSPAVPITAPRPTPGAVIGWAADTLIIWKGASE